MISLKDRIEGAQKLEARRKREYEHAKQKYHEAGKLARKKGPASMEAEVLYPQAKARYQKRGELLRAIRKELQSLQ
jgi:hypothetical protein